MKIALGTVQFGLDYGVSNTNGQVPLEEVGRILDLAYSSGIRVLDTAQAYGTSEEVLGHFDLNRFRIVTKLFEDGNIDDSLERLHKTSVYATLFHRENQVNDKTWAYFEKIKAEGKTQKIGVSSYSPAVLEAIVDHYPVEIVQFPMNMCDFRYGCILAKLKRKNIEIHTRSAFLQGLLLMDPDKMDEYFDEIKPLFRSIPMPRLVYALDCLKQIGEADQIVLGVTKCSELQEVCDAFRAKAEPMDYSKFRLTDERFLNPSQWKLAKNRK